MRTNRALNKIVALFKDDKHTHKNNDEIHHILIQLNTLELKLQGQINKEKDNKKINEIKRTMKLIYSHQLKGEKVLQQRLFS